MKYHGFESPIDWSQYLIQKADKHEYEPSEPGKRVEALLEKLYLPQNSYSYANGPGFFCQDRNHRILHFRRALCTGCLVRVSLCDERTVFLH